MRKFAYNFILLKPYFINKQLPILYSSDTFPLRHRPPHTEQDRLRVTPHFF